MNIATNKKKLPVEGKKKSVEQNISKLKKNSATYTLLSIMIRNTNLTVWTHSRSYVQHFPNRSSCVSSLWWTNSSSLAHWETHEFTLTYINLLLKPYFNRYGATLSVFLRLAGQPCSIRMNEWKYPDQGSKGVWVNQTFNISNIFTVRFFRYLSFRLNLKAKLHIWSLCFQTSESFRHWSTVHWYFYRSHINNIYFGCGVTDLHDIRKIDPIIYLSN